MWNFSKEDRKLVLLLTLLFIFIFTTIFLEVLYNARQTEAEKDISSADTIKDLAKKIKSQPENSESNRLSGYLNEIFALINSKDYTALYSLLSPKFIETVFPTVQDFESFMQSYTPEQYTPQFSSYRKGGDYFVIYVTFAPKEFSESDLFNGDGLRSDFFTIKETGNRKYTFAFNGFVDASLPNQVVSNDFIKITLLESVSFYRSSSFTIKIENLSDFDIVMPQKSIFCTTGVMPRYYSKAIGIFPHSSTTITFEIPTGFSLKDVLPNEIIFNDITINNTTYNFKLPVTYCFDE